VSSIEDIRGGTDVEMRQHLDSVGAPRCRAEVERGRGTLRLAAMRR
jgi:hypothetical protein